MRKINIQIDKLGAIRHQQITLAPVMLFTGESGLGKSYANFLSYYVFLTFSSERMFDFIASKITEDLSTTKKFELTLFRDEIVAWMEQDVQKFFSYLYNWDDFSCQVHFKFGRIEKESIFEYSEVKLPNFDYPDFYTFQVKHKKRSIIAITGNANKERVIVRRIVQLLREQFIGHDYTRTILLPPGRASLLNGDFTVQKGSSKLGLYDIFLTDNDWINSRILRTVHSNEADDFFKTQIHQLIQGDIISDKDGLFLRTADNRKIPLGAAASSIKELSPLLQWIQAGSIRRHSLCIEEPEAHLHPEMQLAVANLLAACINRGAMMQITTHSDYLLQRFNQLLKYGCIREKDAARYQEICETTGHQPDYYLNHSDIKAYYFHSEEGITKILPLEIGEQGIPMSTFFHAVDLLSKEDELLESELEKLSGNA